MMEFCSLSAQNVPEEQFKPEIEIKIRVMGKVVLVVLGGLLPPPKNRTYDGTACGRGHHLHQYVYT